MKTYVKPGLKRNLKLIRTAPVNPLVTQGGIRAKRKEGLYKRAKQVPRKAANHLIRTLDSYHEEEAHEAIQSLRLPKKGTDQAKKSYSQISSVLNRISGQPSTIKSGSRSRTMYRFRKIKGAASTPSASNFSNVSKIKTLSSKFVSKNRFTSLTIKTGLKKALSSPSAFLKEAAQQLTKKLMAKLVTAVVANPKIWAIAAVIGLLLFLIMSVTNSIGGSASSAGSFFMTDEDNAKQYKATVDELNDKLQQQIEDYRDSGYDDVRIDYMNEEGVLQVSWVEIFALVAVKFEQDLTFSDAQKDYMKSLFNQFNRVNTATETYSVEVCSTIVDPESGEEERHCHSESRTRLVVKIYSYDMEDVFDWIGFDEDQKEWARRLVSSGAIQEQFPELAGGYAGGTGPGPGSLTPEELADLMNNLGGDIDKARMKVIETALTLDGKVDYFWGGKSPAGWNDNWGKLVMVTASGSDSTGTLQPYGLDCSGFIDWVFKTAGLGNVFSSGGTSYQWSKTYAITMDELKPGDLVFKNIPGQGGVNHTGIFIGRDTNGNPLYVHCQGSTGVIVNSYKGFKYPRRPLLFQ